MGLKYRTYLEGRKVYGCQNCRSHLANSDGLMSKQFQGQHGQAYLFRYVVNVSEGPEKEKQMTTGKHTITTVFCCQCDTEVGWRYIKAYEDDQKYKEGACILEKALLTTVK